MTTTARDIAWKARIPALGNGSLHDAGVAA